MAQPVTEIYKDIGRLKIQLLSSGHTPEKQAELRAALASRIAELQRVQQGLPAEQPGSLPLEEVFVQRAALRVENAQAHSEDQLPSQQPVAQAAAQPHLPQQQQQQQQSDRRQQQSKPLQQQHHQQMHQLATQSQQGEVKRQTQARQPTPSEQVSWQTSAEEFCGSFSSSEAFPRSAGLEGSGSIPGRFAQAAPRKSHSPTAPLHTRRPWNSRPVMQPGTMAASILQEMATSRAATPSRSPGAVSDVERPPSSPPSLRGASRPQVGCMGEVVGSLKQQVHSLSSKRGTRKSGAQGFALEQQARKLGDTLAAMQARVKRLEHAELERRKAEIEVKALRRALELRRNVDAAKEEGPQPVAGQDASGAEAASMDGSVLMDCELSFTGSNAGEGTSTPSAPPPQIAGLARVPREIRLGPGVSPWTMSSRQPAHRITSAAEDTAAVNDEVDALAAPVGEGTMQDILKTSEHSEARRGSNISFVWRQTSIVSTGGASFVSEQDCGGYEMTETPSLGGVHQSRAYSRRTRETGSGDGTDIYNATSAASQDNVADVVVDPESFDKKSGSLTANAVSSEPCADANACVDVRETISQNVSFLFQRNNSQVSLGCPESIPLEDSPSRRVCAIAESYDHGIHNGFTTDEAQRKSSMRLASKESPNEKSVANVAPPTSGESGSTQQPSRQDSCDGSRDANDDAPGASIQEEGPCEAPARVEELSLPERIHNSNDLVVAVSAIGKEIPFEVADVAPPQSAGPNDGSVPLIQGLSRGDGVQLAGASEIGSASGDSSPARCDDGRGEADGPKPRKGGTLIRREGGSARIRHQAANLSSTLRDQTAAVETASAMPRSQASTPQRGRIERKSSDGALASVAGKSSPFERLASLQTASSKARSDKNQDGSSSTEGILAPLEPKAMPIKPSPPNPSVLRGGSGSNFVDRQAIVESTLHRL